MKSDEQLLTKATLGKQEYLPKNGTGYNVGDSTYTVVYYPLELVFEVEKLEG